MAETDTRPDAEVYRVNCSGGEVRVWRSGEWMVLHVKAGGAETTISLREYDADQVARHLSPGWVRNHERVWKECRETRDALWQFQHPEGAVDLLNAIADERDCGSDCERGYTESDTGAFVCSKDGDGCGWQEAEQLRDLAKAITIRGALTRPDAAGSGSVGLREEIGRALYLRFRGRDPDRAMA